MKDHSSDKRKFTHLSESWYGKENLARSEKIDSVTMGFYCEDGGTSGEFTIVWIELGGRIVPQLRAFDDSWSALWGFRDVLEEMSNRDDENITPKQLCEILIKCGVKDNTQRHYHKEPTP